MPRIRRQRSGLLLTITVMLLLPATVALAEEPTFRLGKLFGDRFEPRAAELTVTDSELRGLGCIAAGAAVGAAAILFSGTAIAVAGGAGAAAATTVAVPVLATAMWAGCAFGSSAAPGLAWMSRNGDLLVNRLGKVLPPVLPGGSSPVP